MSHTASLWKLAAQFLNPAVKVVLLSDSTTVRHSQHTVLPEGTTKHLEEQVKHGTVLGEEPVKIMDHDKILFLTLLSVNCPS